MSATLINDWIKFSCTSGDNPEVHRLYPAAGHNNGYMPLELFLASLCSCLGGTVAALLRRSGKRVDGMVVQEQGKRRTEHPTSFKTIDLTVRVTSAEATEEDMDGVLQAVEPICPVLAMFKGNVAVKVAYEIVQSA